MWFMFAAASLAAIIALYVPGYFFWRAFRFDSLMALCSAPLASVAFICLTAIAFEKVGVPANAASIGLTVLGICLAAFAIASLVGKNRGVTLSFPATFPPAGSASHAKAPARVSRWDWAVLDAYVFFALVVICFVYLYNIASPEAFFSRWDNQTHTSTIRAFIDSNSWSTLKTGAYLAAPQNAQPYLDGPDFYPAAWHDIVAFACSATGASVPCGINAVNTVFYGIVLPVSMFSFVKSAFPGSRHTLVAGAVLASASTVFPWWFFMSGPLYPNFAAVALMPACLGCALAILQGGLFLKKLPSVIALAVFSLISLALLHPNSVFFLYLILASYGSSYIYHLVKERKGRGWAFGLTALFLLAIVAFWFVCLHAPFLSSIVEYRESPNGALTTSIVFLFGLVAVEPLFALLALAGLVVCIRRRSFWLIVPALFMAAAFVLSRVDPAGIGRVFGGFWYCDYRRLGSFFSFALVPLATCGFGALLEAIWKAKRFSGAQQQKLAFGVSGALMAVFFVLNTFPYIEIEIGDTVHNTGFAEFTPLIYEAYNPNVDHVYGTEEVAFVNKVKEITGNELVINQPNDGSTFSYPVNRLNTYYRSGLAGNQNDTAALIRTKLVRYATNEELRKAVEEIGATYVLQLDQGATMEDRVWFPQYKSQRPWLGIEKIRDNTPNFELVLSEGDMRLYRIVKEL